MCGIFIYIGNNQSYEFCIENANISQHRGPDNTQYVNVPYIKNKNITMGFHRLAINGLGDSGNQPFLINGVYMICNGEIYNYKKLIEQFHLEDVYQSGSDCEIIIHLYNKVGIREMCTLLDGEWAFYLYDSNLKRSYCARDHLGIRSLYYTGIDNGTDNGTDNEKNTEKDIIICSEMKSIVGFKGDKIEQFPVGTYYDFERKVFSVYHCWDDNDNDAFSKPLDENIYISHIRRLFIDAVNKRRMSERSIGCLLSGGLDSTTVVAVLSKYYEPYTLNTYSIGLKDSVDLKYAKMASDYLKTNHTTIEFTEMDFLDAIEKTIYQIESYDTTTVRASIGNYLVSLYIRENSQDKVIFCGDVSDEIFGSYRGFYYAKNASSFYRENMRMLNHIQYFDVLRSDKSISGAGLEARVPFSDKEFVNYVMSIPPENKMFNKERMEKYLFRKAFEDYLPDELIWRGKTAFSDGISNTEKPWFQIIQDYMDTKYTASEFEESIKKYKHNQPYDKESLYYREIFEKFYPGQSETIPFFWKQPFCKEQDPSAWKINE